MSDASKDILIVGGGIGGLTLALSLHAVGLGDRDPLDRWTFGCITLLGDAAHPMFPRGGNGAAQAILDAQSLSQRMTEHADDLAAALLPYETERRPATSKVVLQNRTAPPNIIVDTVEKLSGDKPFERIEDVIAPEELRNLFANYQKVAGYHVDVVGKRRGPVNVNDR